MAEQPIAARPKGVQPKTEEEEATLMLATTRTETPYVDAALAREKRGPGRPPKPDLFTVLVRISEELRGVAPDERVQILQTLTNLSK